MSSRHRPRYREAPRPATRPTLPVWVAEADVQRIKDLADLERPDAVLEIAHVGAAKRCEVQQGRRVEFLVGEQGFATAVVMFAVVLAMVVMRAFLTVWQGTPLLLLLLPLPWTRPPPRSHNRRPVSCPRGGVPSACSVCSACARDISDSVFVELGLDGDHLGGATRHLDRVQDRGIIATSDVRTETGLEQTTKAYSARSKPERARKGWDPYLDAVIQHQPDPSPCRCLQITGSRSGDQVVTQLKTTWV